MKKLICLILSILMLAALCACDAASSAAPAAPAKIEAPAVVTPDVTAEPMQMVNPMTACQSLEQINEALGCVIAKPPVMGITDEQFYIIEAGEYFDIGQYSFKVNGMDYCLRFSADYSKDISGVYVDGGTAFSGEVRELEYAEANGMKLSRWATTDGQYCLSISDNGSMAQDTFQGITEELRSLYVRQDVDAGAATGMYSYMVGEYLDAYSGRATATVSAEGDIVYFTVSWANSAFEVYKWTMSAKQSEDGLFYYYDCISSVLNYDQNGNESESILYTNGEGFFGEYEGRISWNGAADENCQNCVFEKQA